MSNVVSIKPKQPVSSGSAVKSVALTAFRLLRSAGSKVQKLPGMVQQAGIEIRDAWEESRPNV